jgi:two-component system chemotaxis response regulator CheY
MLKAVLFDGNAIARDLLAQILTNGSYEVVGGTNSGAKAISLATRFQPHIICINAEQMNEDREVLPALLQAAPKALIFMVSVQFDAAMLQDAHQRGVHGFIVKPFNEATVLNTIRKAVLTLVKKHQARASSGTEPDAAS